MIYKRVRIENDILCDLSLQIFMDLHMSFSFRITVHMYRLNHS